jgi:hypothetical protein
MLIDEILLKYLGPPFEWRMVNSYPSKDKINALIHDLENLKKEYPNDYSILYIFSDIYLMLGDYGKAINYCPIPDIKQKWTLVANRRLNLKILSNEKCVAREYLALFSKRITKFGFVNIGLVEKMVQILIDDWENNKGVSIIEWILHEYPEIPKKIHNLFNGTFYLKEPLTKILFYSFDESKELEILTKDLTRQAENIVREDRGLPKVGEGWLSETNLYYEIKEFLPNYEVILHGSPDWLNNQHLDIFIPKLSLAFEYQGLQHDKPLEYFGGEEAFKIRQQLDIKKSNLCKRHGVKIIYVREGYDINTLKKSIFGTQ